MAVYVPDLAWTDLPRKDRFVKAADIIRWESTLGTLSQGIATNAAYIINVKDSAYGAVGDGVTDDTNAIQSAITTLGVNGGTLYFPAGKYLTTGIVIRSISNFTLRGERGAALYIAASTVASPFQVTRNILTIADCTDFVVEGLAIDGRRDSVAPQAVLRVNAASGQPSVKIPNGASASYVVGQRLNLNGGLTANSGTEANQTEQHVISSLTVGTAGADDTVTFTTNLVNSYTAIAGSGLSDGYGPYAANGAYVTPWQTGESYSVAGRTLSEEDQQNGIHLINCRRFRVSGCEIRNVWENSIRMGTHLLDGTAQNDGCAYGVISDNVIYHGYDQGVAVWCSHDITVTGNVISAAGWGGIVLTMSDDCTVTGNVCSDNVQRIPGDTADGNGIAIEGGARNTIVGNKIRNNYSIGIYLTAAGTLPFASPAQVATTVAAGSNAVALPAGTINVASAAAFAASGQLTVLSSAGAQQITYTGKTGTSLTGCTGGIGTLFTGQRVVQYPLFVANGAALPIASTNITTSDGTKFQVNGHYSIIDGPRTERIDVVSIAGNIITLLNPTTFRHPDKCQIGQAVCENNTVAGNAVSGGNAAGIQLSSAVRTSIFGNSIDRPGLRGIDLFVWTAGGVQPPAGTVINGNVITAPDAVNDGGSYEAIMAQQCSDLEIVYNRCGGAASTQGYFIALHLQGCTDSVIAGNIVADTYAIGIRLDNSADWVCKRVQVTGNEILRVYGEGLLLWGGDALTIAGNVITGCAANNGPGGFGGALDVRGVANSQILSNVVINNGHGGIGLDDATINAVTVHSSGNVIAQNTVRDDGANYDSFNGALTQQGSGIKELSANQGPNTYLANLVSGNATNWSITSTGNTLRGNQNYNPVGKFASQPAVPASGTAQTNNLNADATVFVTGGTVSAISVGGQASGLTSGTFRVLAGQTITLTYTVAPTWAWFGD